MTATRQRVRLSEVHNLIRPRLDFSAGNNSLVGYTNAKGEYVIKSNRQIVVVIGADNRVEAYLEEADPYHVPFIKGGIQWWAKQFGN
jgi:hypothetical protein